MFKVTPTASVYDYDAFNTYSQYTYRVNSKYVTILKPQDLQEVNKPKMWLNILNS
jgi:hypothetical protein